MGHASSYVHRETEVTQGQLQNFHRGAVQGQKGLETLLEAEFPYQTYYFCMILCFSVVCFT